MNEHPPQPTPEQCSAKARFVWNDHECMAIWYPQMGGYVGRAVAVNIPTNGDATGCVDVYVWHDGEFPFNEGDEWGGPGPRYIHHCDPAQFIHFGEELDAFQEAIEGKEPDQFNRETELLEALRGLIAITIPPSDISGRAMFDRAVKAAARTGDEQ